CFPGTMYFADGRSYAASVKAYLPRIAQGGVRHCTFWVETSGVRSNSITGDVSFQAYSVDRVDVLGGLRGLAILRIHAVLPFDPAKPNPIDSFEFLCDGQKVTP